MSSTSPSFTPQSLTFNLPSSPHLRLHVSLTTLTHCTLIHLTTTGIDQSSTSAVPMGSFVYALPDRLKPNTALSTALCEEGSSIDFATRVAKILARKMGRPVYVGCSVSLAGMNVEEEMEGVRMVVEKVSTFLEAKKERNG